MAKNNFKDLATKKYYEFFRNKIDNGEITPSELAKVIGKYQTNPSGFLNSLRTGTGVTISNIFFAKKHFGLNAGSLFDEDGSAMDIYQKDVESYPSAAEDEKPYLTEKVFNDMAERNSELKNQLRECQQALAAEKKKRPNSASHG